MAITASPAAGSSSSSSARTTPPGSDASGYQLVHQDEGTGNDADEENTKAEVPIFRPRPEEARYRHATYILSVCIVILLASTLFLSLPYSFTSAVFGGGGGGDQSQQSCPCAPSRVPQYFQTKPELWAGPTATGAAPFLAQTRVIDATETYVPNEPLQTAIPIEGMHQGNDSIFRMMGYLSPYRPAPGFGVDEYPLPRDAEIVQVQMLSRHGARYPTTGSDVARLGEHIAKAAQQGTAEFKGPLSFLKEWKYQLGAEILVPKGRQELYDSGEFLAPPPFWVPVPM